MSRGHGTRQRQLLDRADRADDKGVYVVPRGSTPADAAALRRAAYRLESEGHLHLRHHQGRLAMWHGDTEPPLEDWAIIGADGRIYRSPDRGMTKEACVDELDRRRRHEEMSARYAPLAEAHGHEAGPGVPMCRQCAEAAGADEDLLQRLR